MKHGVYRERASKRDSLLMWRTDGVGVEEVNAFAKRRSRSSISRWQLMDTVRGSVSACSQILRRSSKGSCGKSVNVARGDVAIAVDWGEDGLN